MRCPVLLPLAVAVAVSASAPSVGRAGLLSPGDPVAGVSQAELSVLWTQWAFSYPVGGNPVDDTTGSLAYLGNQGSYFFLAGSFGSDPVTRTATVGADQSLFFPLADTVSAIPFFGSTEAEIRQDASDTIGVVSNLSLTLDGTPLALPAGTSSLLDFRQVSPPGTFGLTFPANAEFGVPPGTYQSVTDGYWVALAPLASGHYQLHFTAESVGTGAYAGIVGTQDITYNLNVVPEPSGVVALTSGAIGVVGYLLRRKVSTRPRERRRP